MINEYLLPPLPPTWAYLHFKAKHTQMTATDNRYMTLQEGVAPDQEGQEGSSMHESDFIFLLCRHGPSHNLPT
jgi:hypothetical protein